MTKKVRINKAIFGKKVFKSRIELEFYKSDYIASKDVNAWLGIYEVIK